MNRLNIRVLIVLATVFGILLYLISFFSGGFILIIGVLAEAFASAARLVIGLMILTIIVFFVFLKALFSQRRFLTAKTRSILRLLMLVLVFLIILIGIINAVAVVPNSGGLLLDNYIERIDTPIPVTMTRIIPLETAYAYAISLLQTPTHTIYMDESYLYYINDSVVYNWIIEPEGFWNELFRDAYGAVFINGSAYPPKVNFVNLSLYWSLHRMRLTPFYVDTLLREIKAKAIPYKPLFKDNVEILLNGKIYILIPLMTWKTGFTTYLPMLYGYAVVYPDGRVDIVEASKLKNHPITRVAFYDYKVPIMPEAIAREWIELYRWSPGFPNVVLYHQTFTIRDIGTNPQPYLVFDDKGHLYWLFIAEPSGESYAIKYIIYVDAQATEPRILVYKPEIQWIGASKISSYIQKAHPRYDWQQFKLAEPIPLIINNTLYWKVTIITSDGRGVISIELVDALTGNVYSLPVETKLPLAQFKLFLKTLSGQAINETPITPTQNTLQRIREMKQRIQEMINELQKLLQELKQLEEQINKTS